MILADKRYQRSDKMEKLPLWIQKRIYSAYTSVDMAEQFALKFFKEMA